VPPLVILAVAGHARAHRLEAECRVLPGQRVRVESWFDLTGDSPAGARVQVFRADGQLLTEGRLDREGLFVFSYPKAERLRVVVSAGAGHRKELEISETDLARPVATTEADRLAPSEPAAPPPASIPRADRSTQVTVKDVLVGVGFLLAVAAFVLSVRNARQLRDLRRGG
jgi:nickel transport protein